MQKVSNFINVNIEPIKQHIKNQKIYYGSMNLFEIENIIMEIDDYIIKNNNLILVFKCIGLEEKIPYTIVKFLEKYQFTTTEDNIEIIQDEFLWIDNGFKIPTFHVNVYINIPNLCSEYNLSNDLEDINYGDIKDDKSKIKVDLIYSYIINQTTLYNTLYVGDKQDILTFKYDDNIYKNKKLSLGQFLFPDELIYKERKYYNKNEYIYTTLYVNSEEELENIINNNKTISIKKTYPYKIENLDTSKDLIRQYVWKYFKAPGYVDIEYNLKYYTYVIREEK